MILQITEMFAQLAQYGIAFLVLGLSLLYFYIKEKGYIDQINKLNNELKINQKETLQTLIKTTTILDKLIQDSADNNESVHNELQEIKEELIRRLNK
jgi:hypothetical protein